MNDFDRRDLEVALRHDLASFIQRSFQTVVPAAEYQDNWHIDAIAWHLRTLLCRCKIAGDDLTTW